LTDRALPPVTLEALLKKQGHWQRATTSSGATVFIKCFNKNHDDKGSSMAINRGTGKFHCNHCGIDGDALAYLTKYLKKSPAQAEKILTSQYQWPSEKIDHADSNQAEKDRVRAGMPRIVPDLSTKALQNNDLVGEHHYTDTKGKTIMVVVRAEKDGNQKLGYFTPRTNGGYWHSKPHNSALPKQDRIETYPVYNLLSTTNNEHTIYVVENEWTADLISNLKDGPKVGLPPCVCLPAGIRMTDIDLSTIAGRQVIVFAAASNGSRNRARTVAKALHENGCAVKTVMPKGETGYDVGMAAAEGGWDGIVKWVKKFGNLSPWITKQAQTQPSEPADIDNDRIANNQHYQVLGLRDLLLLIQIKETSEIIPFNRAQMSSSGNLMTIAPLDFWVDINNNAGLTTQSRERFADALIRAAHRKGTIKKMHLFVGRGAFIDERSGEVMFNTGTKLLSAGSDGKLTVEKDLSESSNFAMGGEEITIKDDPSAHDYAREMADCILAYRWKEANDALAFLGWIVAAVIGGALAFRPTLWLCAGKGQGKSFLVSDVLAKLFAEMSIPIGDPTEAFIAEATKSDSLPTILDEFEPEGSQMQQAGWLNIMKSVRLASTGSAARGRSGGHGKVNMHTARYTAFISSIRRAKLSPATLDRIFPVSFGDEIENWFELEDRVKEAFRVDKCVAVISLIIRNTAILSNEVKALSRELATKRNMSTRLAAMCAALSVGARFFTDTGVIVSHPEEHQESGELDLLRELLAATAYKDEGQEFSIADCLTTGYFENGLWVGRQVNGVYSKDAAIAASYGFGMLDDHTMLLCGNAPRMKNLLARTQHENTDLSHYIRHLPRIESNGRCMQCAGQTFRAKELPLSVYKHTGFDPTKPDLDDVEL